MQHLSSGMPGARALLAVLVSAMAVSMPLDAQRLGYTLIPTATRVNWDDALPLEDRALYGGRLALLFGAPVELQPFYLRGTKIGVDSARGSAAFGAAALDRTLRVEHFGTNLQVNFGGSDVEPFLRVGGGVLRFQPDSGARVNRISVLAGGGIRVNLGGIQGQLYAEQFRFRLLPARLFGADTTAPTATNRAPMLRNTSYGVALTVPLSSFEGEPSSTGLRGTRAPFEPFVGRLKYHDDLGLADQDIIGVRTGLDFGPLVGLRGYYWRGINSDYDDTDPVSSYGGEAQFNLNAGTGISPYLVVGAGRIDRGPGFRDIAGLSRADETGLILGGGASFSLTDRVRLNIALRDFITTQDEALTDARGPDDLFHNRLFSAGLTFSVGGRSGAPARRAPAVASTAPQTQGTESQTVSSREGSTAQREVVRLREGNAALRRAAVSKPDTVMGVTADTLARRVMVPGAGIVIPATGLGEVIIRYGPMTSSRTEAVKAGSASSVDTVRLAVPTVDTVRVLEGPRRDASVLEARLAELERRLEVQREELDRARRQQDLAGTRDDTPFRVTPTAEGDTMRIAPARSFGARLGAARPADVTPFLGIDAGDGTQAVISGRVDLGPVTEGSTFDLVPELSFGTGSDRTTLLALANLRYTFGSVGGVQPYVMGGAGFFSRSLLAVGTSVGASTNVRGLGSSPLYLFGEVQGLNFFSHTRVLVGLSTRR